MDADCTHKQKKSKKGQMQFFVASNSHTVSQELVLLLQIL